MASLELDFSAVWQKVAEFLGIVSIGTAPTGTDLTTVQDITYRAYRQFLNPVNPRTGRSHIWSFLKQNYTISVNSDNWRIVLPPNFDRLWMNFKHDLSSGYPPLVKVTKDFILEQRAKGDTSSYPTHFAIVAGKFDSVAGQFQEVWFWPAPQSSYVLHCTYIIQPPKPSATTDHFVGGMKAAEAILELALSVAEQQLDDVVGIHTQLAMPMIQKMIEADTADVADGIGRNLDPSVTQRLYQKYLRPLVGGDDIYANQF